jgi:signal peptidase II
MGHQPQEAIASLARLVLSAGVVAALDQATKILVTSRLVAGHTYVVGWQVRLRRVTNTRAGLLSLSNRQAVMIWLAVVSCLGLVLATVQTLPPMGAVALGLALGGATSNLGERIVRGGVVDFIAIWKWPAFNIADAAMVLGVALAVWSVA